MNNFWKKLILILFISFSSLQIAHSQSGWTVLYPSMNVNSISSISFANSNTGFASAESGKMLKSTDGGISWTLVNLPTTKNLNSVFFADSLTGFVAGNSGVFFKTTDAGSNWVQLNFPYDTTFLKYIYFRNPLTGYLMTTAGVFRSSNGGIGWQLVSNAQARAIYFPDETNGFLLYMSTIYKSTNSGMNWTELYTYLSYSESCLYFPNTNTGIVGGSDAFFWKTTDGGLNWDFNRPPSGAHVNAMTFLTPSTAIAAADYNVIYRTTDSGSTWQDVNAYSLGSNNICAAKITDNKVCVGGQKNIFYSSNSGINWVKTPFSITSTMNSVFFTSALTGYCGSDSSYIYKTTSGGISWYRIFEGVPSRNISKIYFVNPDIGFAKGDYLFRTTNAGTNWTVPEQPGLQNFNCIKFINQSTGFCGGSESSTGWGSIYKTTNTGNNWIKKTGTGFLSVLDFSFPDLNTGYACTYQGYIVKTTNSGENWTVLQSGLAPWLYSICFIDALTGYVSGSTILKTTNGGYNWTQIYNDGFMHMQFVNQTTAYASSGAPYQYYGSIYKTTNAGFNWVIQYHTTTRSVNDIFFLDENTGYGVGSGGLILKTTTGGEPIGIQQISNEVPSSFVLQQNYPNPFNPTTKIKFSLPNPSEGGAMKTKIVIYDITGREVATLFNEQLSPGTYEVDWDGTNFASGIYFYQLQTPEFRQTKKMVLLK